ncbi:MAG: hypothetical protein Q9187_003873 [Circinaria calcarea]
MGVKRPYEDDVHPSRQQNVHLSQVQPAKRSRPNSYLQASPRSKPASVSVLKGKIRDLSRLLERSRTLPADVRIEKERALAGYKADLEKRAEEKRRKDMIGKYHMVRFFERQKATRALKKLQKQASALSPSSPERTSLSAAIHDTEVDLNYTIYHPLTEKYQSLYARTDKKGSGEVDGERRNGDEKEEGKPGRKRPPLWNIVEISMTEGTLEELRDGRIWRRAEVLREKPPAKQEPRAVKKDKESHDNSRGGARTKHDEQAMADEDDGLSDGGFFEM